MEGEGASSSSAPAPGQPLNAGGPESEAGGEQDGTRNSSHDPSVCANTTNASGAEDRKAAVAQKMMSASRSSQDLGAVGHTGSGMFKRSTSMSSEGGRSVLDMDTNPQSSPFQEYRDLAGGGESYLDTVLGEEFEGVNMEVPVDEKKSAEAVAKQGGRKFGLPNISRTSIGSRNDSVVSVDKEITVHSPQSRATRIVENRAFIGCMMFLTMYALYAPDLDRCFGSRDTQLEVQSATTLVCIFFLVEMVLQCMGKPKYPGRAHFWLDLISLLSLLPETLLVQIFVSNNSAFVASRSTRVTQIIRVVARSSKAARLNRLSRIIRVAALMPRLQQFFGRGIKEDDAERLLQKKLYRIFQFLDEDMDGYVSRQAAGNCLDKVKALAGLQKKSTWAIKVGMVMDSSGMGRGNSIGNAAAGLLAAKRQAKQDGEAGDSALPSSASSTQIPSASSGLGPRGQSLAALARKAKSSPHLTMVDEAGETMKTSSSAAATSSVPEPERLPKSKTVAALKQAANEAGLEPPRASGGSTKKPSKDSSVVKQKSSKSKEQMDFDDFRTYMLSDPQVFAKMKNSCRQHLKQSNNMHNVTSRNSEYVGVKVALSVLLLLFILTFIEPTVDDKSALWGVRTIDGLVRDHFANQSATAPVPPLISQQVATWTQGPEAWDSVRRVPLYLEFDKRIYCNELLQGAAHRSCAPANTTGLLWQGGRESLNAIDAMLRQMRVRQEDLVLLRYPEYEDEIVSEDELERGVTTIALLNMRAESESMAAYSMLTTSLVIIIILTGISLLTKDLTFLSRNLLKPLVELADEMESISRLQLAGVSASPEDNQPEQGTSEIRLIRRTFDNMKMAIKSWGKYVPWPVVQLLLRKDAEADIEVSEQEVTIFFSDIASFTTIVEGLQPERSLLLLSRYFHDMSKIIDEYEGIVLEFIGDAIMSIYGAPVKNKEHPTAGVKSALRMLASLKVMNQWFKDHDLPEISIRCGVHTGKVLVGNMGFQSRMKYGVVGEESNIPGRLEELNKTYSTEMLISHATYSRIQPKLFIIRPIDYVNLFEVPGAPVELVYQVVDRNLKGDLRGPKKRSAMTEYASGLELYRDKNWADAIAKFEKVQTIWQDAFKSEDVPSSMMVKRCKSYQENPPPPDWDGLWDRGN